MGLPMVVIRVYSKEIGILLQFLILISLFQCQESDPMIKTTTMTYDEEPTMKSNKQQRRQR